MLKIASPDIARGNGSARRHQGLGGDLAPEHPLALLGRLGAPEDVDFDGLEVEQADQPIKGFAHGHMLAVSGAVIGTSGPQKPSWDPGGSNRTPGPGWLK
jgi:hypothetical protein